MPTHRGNQRSAEAAGLVYVRLRLGLDREGLAQAINDLDAAHGWTESVVSNIENDRRGLRPRELRDLSRLLGVDQDFLLDGIPLTDAPVTVRYLFPAELTPSLEAAAA